MNPARFEIWLAQFPVGLSRDARPCVVIAQSGPDAYLVMPISSAMQLMSSAFDFRFSPIHPDFSATGLRKECFAIGNELKEIPRGVFIKKWGCLHGQLAREFENWLT